MIYDLLISLFGTNFETTLMLIGKHYLDFSLVMGVLTPIIDYIKEREVRKFEQVKDAFMLGFCLAPVVAFCIVADIVTSKYVIGETNVKS